MSPSEVGKCAGYSLSPAVISNCLNGKECLPSFTAGHLYLDALKFGTRESIQSLAASASFPRVQLGKLEEVAKSAKACLSKGRDHEFCLLQMTSAQNPQLAETVDCIRNAKGNSEKLEECAVKRLPEQKKKQVECLRQNVRNQQGLALCAVGDQLPPNARQYLACMTDPNRNASKRDPVECAVQGNREAKCLSDNKKDWKKATLCIAGDSLPGPVKSALDCAQMTSTAKDYGICMLAKEGGGEAQRIAACYAEANGIPAAIAVCLASQHLTQDQRIVLQCAAQTNGAIQATATCATGKMAVKEMMNCQGKGFAEDKCFGESNEFRKVLKTFGTDIGPKSVVADAANIQLRIASATWGKALQEGMDKFPDVVKFATEHRIIPNPEHPERAFVGPLYGVAVDDYCKHNHCPKIPTPGDLLRGLGIR